MQKHRRHLERKAGGVCANPGGMNPCGRDLSGATLQVAILKGCDLADSRLVRADLSLADLFGANLLRAEMQEANLLRADLRGGLRTGPDGECGSDRGPHRL